HRDIDRDGRVLGPELIEDILDAFGDTYCVRARFFEEEEPDGVSAVVSGHRLALLEAVFHPGQVREGDRRLARNRSARRRRGSGRRAVPSLPFDGDAPDLFDIFQFTEGSECVAISSSADGPAGCRSIRRLECGLDVIDGEAEAFEAGRVDLDADLAFEPAGDR